MELEELRREINFIDDEILRLLEKRILLAMETKKFKKNIVDADREREIYNRLKSASLTEEQVQKIYSAIIQACRKAQSD